MRSQEANVDSAEQEAVAAVLRTRPDAAVPIGFASRVSARIAAEGLKPGGWFGEWLALADWRAWTIGLVPVVGAVVLAVALTSASTTPAVASDEEGSGPEAAAILINSTGVGGDALLSLALTGRVDGLTEVTR